MKLKANAPLLVALALPVLLVIAIAGAIYIPGRSLEPKEGFLYTANDSNRPYPYTYNHYVVIDGRIAVEKTPQPMRTDPAVPAMSVATSTIYRFDPKTGESREISFDDAGKLALSSAPRSNDGFELSRGLSGGFDVFGGDYNSWYLRKGNRAKKIELVGSGSGYAVYPEFIGWIVRQ